MLSHSLPTSTGKVTLLTMTANVKCNFSDSLTTNGLSTDRLSIFSTEPTKHVVIYTAVVDNNRSDNNFIFLKQTGSAKCVIKNLQYYI